MCLEEGCQNSDLLARLRSGPQAEIPEPDKATIAVVVVEAAYPHLRWRFHVCVEALIGIHIFG
jgi:hypothetical protein